MNQKGSLIAWQEIGFEDWAATSPCKQYYFRAENMGDNWWWSVDYLGHELSNSWLVEPGISAEHAMELAEKVYRDHINGKK